MLKLFKIHNILTGKTVISADGVEHKNITYDWMSKGDNIYIDIHARVVNAHRIKVGNDFYLGEDSIIHVGEVDKSGTYDAVMTLGNRVTFNRRCTVYCFERIDFGDDVIIASDVFISDTSKGIDARESYRYQHFETKPVSIGSHAWVGEKAIVLPGVKIGEHAIVGAGSVVTKDVPAYTMAVGNPARVIKKWNMDMALWERV